MSRNFEVKTRVADVLDLTRRAESIASEGPVEIAQDDTFFRCDSGRLKLRQLGDGTGELIYYRRANLSGPKESFFLRSQTSQPDNLRESLRLAYGVVELEVALAEGESTDSGAAEARRIMRELGVDERDLLECAYVDLLAQLGV